MSFDNRSVSYIILLGLLSYKYIFYLIWLLKSVIEYGVMLTNTLFKTITMCLANKQTIFIYALLLF